MKFEIAAFTEKGAALGKRIVGLYPDSEVSAPGRYHDDVVKPFDGGVGDWTRPRFKKGRNLLFIGATGVAVRAIAPLLRDKSVDPAVICIDENGENVIPLLSGHMGGANQGARELARSLGARAVITTATDLQGAFAADSWAVLNNCAVSDLQAIKVISSALLDGEKVGLASEFPIEGGLPLGIVMGIHSEKGIEIALKSVKPFSRTLTLIPRIIIAGIGCRRGTPAERIEEQLKTELARLGLPLESVGTIASIDIKADEKGLMGLCEKLGADFVTFSSEELMAARGEFTKSERVLQAVGTDNVCERAVALAGGEMILRKSVSEGLAIALGKLDYKICFEQEA